MSQEALENLRNVAIRDYSTDRAQQVLTGENRSALGRTRNRNLLTRSQPRPAPVGLQRSHKVRHLQVPAKSRICRDLRSLFLCELALLSDQAVQPGEADVASGLIPEGAFGVHIPVEGLAVVAQAPVQLADEVSGHGELPPAEALFPQGADEVADGSKLEGALKGVLTLLAADPRGAEAEVA